MSTGLQSLWRSDRESCRCEQWRVCLCPAQRAALVTANTADRQGLLQLGYLTVIPRIPPSFCCCCSSLLPLVATCSSWPSWNRTASNVTSSTETLLIERTVFFSRSFMCFYSKCWYLNSAILPNKPKQSSLWQTADAKLLFCGKKEIWLNFLVTLVSQLGCFCKRGAIWTFGASW